MIREFILEKRKESFLSTSYFLFPVLIPRPNPESPIIRKIQKEFDGNNDYFSTIKVIDGINGVKLLALTNICYEVNTKEVKLYSTDENFLSSRYFPDSMFFTVIFTVIFNLFSSHSHSLLI